MKKLPTAAFLFITHHITAQEGNKVGDKINNILIYGKIRIYPPLPCSSILPQLFLEVLFLIFPDLLLHLFLCHAILSTHQNHGQYFFQIILSVRRILPGIRICLFMASQPENTNLMEQLSYGQDICYCKCGLPVGSDSVIMNCADAQAGHQFPTEIGDKK